MMLCPNSEIDTLQGGLYDERQCCAVRQMALSDQLLKRDANGSRPERLKSVETSVCVLDVVQLRYLPYLYVSASKSLGFNPSKLLIS